MAVKLYRCKTPTDRLCPCGRVNRALREAGIDAESERVPLGATPEKRPEVHRLTGQTRVPVLVEADGTATHDSARIIERIRSGAVSV